LTAARELGRTHGLHDIPAGTAIDEHGVTVSPWPLVHASGETALGVIEDIRETGSAVTPIIVGPAED